MFEPQNPRWRERVEEIFARAAFVREIGIRLLEVGPGWVESEVRLEPRHLSQDNIIHAGVQATLADHSAGAAAGTLMPPDHVVLSIEFKIQLLRPAVGERLRCHAEVLRPGRQVVATESQVFAEAGGVEKLVSKLTASMIYLPAERFGG